MTLSSRGPEWLEIAELLIAIVHPYQKSLYLYMGSIVREHKSRLHPPHATTAGAVFTMYHVYYREITLYLNPPGGTVVPT